MTFIREVSNQGGTKSCQVIKKHKGKYIVLKTFGFVSSSDTEGMIRLRKLAEEFIHNPPNQSNLFNDSFANEEGLENNLIQTIKALNAKVRLVGPELIIGPLFDRIGLNQVMSEKMFRHLVISRLVFPLSKLKTVDYLRRYSGIETSVSTVYRFLDELKENHEDSIKQTIYNHTKRIVGNTFSVVFYDLTTLYFETEDEDDLRKIGFSKDGKFRHPQIVLGLLVALDGLPVSYDIFPGNTYEGKTMVPFLEKVEKDYDIGKPIVIADAGLLNNENIKILEDNNYQYIIGARIKNETEKTKTQILKQMMNRQYNQITFIKKDNARLIISYSDNRKRKDEYNRERGLKKLKDKIKSGKLNKEHINNRGYNKFLKLDGQITVKLDETKIEGDKQWDGLKGYVTNTNLRVKTIISQYNQLWKIEKAFRISKTDLKIRPIYHHLDRRIKSHVCVVFAAYAVYKELERILHKTGLSPTRAIELTQTWYALAYTLPSTEETKYTPFNLNEEQESIQKIIQKYLSTD